MLAPHIYVGSRVKVPDGYHPDGSPRPWRLGIITHVGNTTATGPTGSVWIHVRFSPDGPEEPMPSHTTQAVA